MGRQYRVLLFGDVQATAGGATAVVVESSSTELLTARQLLLALSNTGGSSSGTGSSSRLLAADGRTPFVPPPCWGDVVRPSILAVDLEYVSETALDTVVPPSVEVALIPPISGG